MHWSFSFRETSTPRRHTPIPTPTPTHPHPHPEKRNTNKEIIATTTTTTKLSSSIKNSLLGGFDYSLSPSSHFHTRLPIRFKQNVLFMSLKKKKKKIWGGSFCFLCMFACLFGSFAWWPTGVVFVHPVRPSICWVPSVLVYLGLKCAIYFRYLLEIVHRSKIVPARRSVSKCLAVNTCVASRHVDDERVWWTMGGQPEAGRVWSTLKSSPSLRA